MNLFHRFIKLTKSAYHETNLRSDDAFIDQATNWGYCDNKWLGSPKILIAAGHGYGNVGDEAQLAACLSRWHKFLPNCKITLFSPNPAYTAALHN